MLLLQLFVSWGGAFYLSDFADEAKSKTYTSNISEEHEPVFDHQVPTTTEILQNRQKEPKALDDLQEQNHIRIMEKDANTLIAEADSFIKEHNLTIPSNLRAEKQKVIAQVKIDEIQNSLNLLDDQLNSLGEVR